MPPSAPIAQQEALVGFMLDKFEGAYDFATVAQQDKIGAIMDGWQSERRTETYGANRSAPYPSRLDRGKPRPSASFDSVNWSTSSVGWSVKVPWHAWDERDNQLKDTQKKAAEAGENFRNLDDRVLAQIIEGGTDNDLLESVPTSGFDGQAVYSATDETGGARYGVTNGNLLTATGLTAPDIQTDYFNGIEQALQFLDTHNQPLVPESVIMSGIICMFPVEMMKAAVEAFKQLRIGVVLGTDAGTTPSNVIIDAGMNFSLWFNPYLSVANDWYMFFTGIKTKPFYRQEHEPLQHWVQDHGNSDEARDHNIKALIWESRVGYGVGPCFQTIKFNTA